MSTCDYFYLPVMDCNTSMEHACGIPYRWKNNDTTGTQWLTIYFTVCLMYFVILIILRRIKGNHRITIMHYWFCSFLIMFCKQYTILELWYYEKNHIFHLMRHTLVFQTIQMVISPALFHSEMYNRSIALTSEPEVSKHYFRLGNITSINKCTI